MNEMHTSIYEKLNVLQALMKRQEKASQERFGPFADTSRGQGRILAMLKIQPEIATRDLAFLLGIRQQSLNELLNKLEKGGYVIRKPSEKDRRVMMVCLTEKGNQEPAGIRDHEEYLSALSPEELEKFGEYLDRIIAVLQKAQPEDRDDQWMNQARQRMGDESFEQLMNMRQRAFGGYDWQQGYSQRPGQNGPNGFGEGPAAGGFGQPENSGPRGGFGKQDSGFGPQSGFGKPGPDFNGFENSRDFSPSDIPGSERFSEEYDGPVPDRDGFDFFDGSGRK